MTEIRWHGRGGHGSFTAARLLGYAASVVEGNYAQAFPSFGPERRGAPVLGFTRIDAAPINDHSQVYACDYVVVLDETLMDTIDVSQGLKNGGSLIINSAKAREKFGFSGNVYVIDAAGIALRVLGSPIANTVMLGAAAGISGLVALDSVCKAIDALMPEDLRERNKEAARIAYAAFGGGGGA